jgi:hypothetical protein
MPASVEYTEQASPLPATPPGTLVQNAGPSGAVAATNDPGTTTTPGGTGAAQQPGAVPSIQPMAGVAGTGAPVAMGTGGVGAPITMMTGTGGAGVMSGAGGMSAPTTGAAATKLTATITTVTQGGKYAPKNVGAIWIADSSGKWLFTLEYWNSLVNSQWLTKYNSVNGPAYVLFGATAPADTVTGATLAMHKTHTVNWSFKDSKGQVVPDGAYKLMIELTEASATGKTQEYDFMKGPAASTTPADTAYFTGVKIDLK